MSKSNIFENEILKHILQNENVALIGDATGLRGSTAAGSLYISLHTANPGESGNQTTSEATFTSYARVAVARTTGKWSVTDNVGANIDPITFPECTGGSNSVTYFGIGTDASGTGKLLFWGQLTAPLAISTGITAEFATGALTITED
jgi:hypothetical protein